MSFAVEVITLVPELWPTLLSSASGLVGKGFERGLARLTVSDLRDFGRGRHKQVDDTPFGGGAGMVLQVEPLHRAIERARARTAGPVVLLTPRGERFSQAQAARFARGPGLTV
ncbi:MAG: tRNA (guanosine(37)-N1)-methyltransferase TrmD, partial [Myxococcota bacterium]